MNHLILATAIPGFLLLMGIEYFIVQRKKLNCFQFNSSIANLCIGVAERLSDLFLAGIFYSIFDYIEKHFGIFEIRASILSYLVLLLATDFLWYWYHRSGHEINLFWAAHIVHHQSEEFNFTVSARITMFQSLVRLLFWSLLPLIGFSAGMVTIILMAHGLYPFFLHTRIIGKLGFLEKIFVTPSHHRVHHASNEHYLDKNYGSILILWDKWFGTFAEEQEEPVYGLTTPLKSHSFLWQHFHYYLELFELLRIQPDLHSRIKILFGKPVAIPTEIKTRLEQRFLLKNVNEPFPVRPVMKRYIWSQLLVTFVMLIFLTLQPALPASLVLLASLFIILTLINCCAILEQRTWIFYLEYARLMVLVLSCVFLSKDPLLLAGLMAILYSIWYYKRAVQKLFLQFIYGPIFYYRMIAKDKPWN